MKRDGYQIISEVLSGNPNVDMLVIRPYLYVYVEKDKMDSVKQNGIATGPDGSIDAFLARLPESQYSEYLETHMPVKISVSKLTKIKDQKVVLRPKNFKYSKDSLDDEDIQKIVEKGSQKLSEIMASKKEISKLPMIKVECSGKIIPAFCVKPLDVTEMSLKKKLGAKMAKLATNKKVRDAARATRGKRGNPTTMSWMARMGNTKVKEPAIGSGKGYTRKQAKKIMNRFAAAGA